MRKAAAIDRSPLEIILEPVGQRELESNTNRLIGALVVGDEQHFAER